MFWSNRISPTKILQQKHKSLLNIKNLISRPSTAEYNPLKKIGSLLYKKSRTIKLNEENPIYKKSKVFY